MKIAVIRFIGFNIRIADLTGIIDVYVMGSD